MRNPLQTPFAAVFQTEVLLNSKRIAPYVLIILFTAHAVLWWGWSAAATFGWATSSDFNIVRNFLGFSFLGLPIFNAVIMCDPVIRDFRLGVDPLIFSKPISRASYLFGKFFGNFFVLVCCQSAFMLTMMLLQWVPLSRLVVQPVRVFPYFKHFIFFVVISHLVLAVIYFTVGTLTRNASIAYGLAVAFYPVYIASQVMLITRLPERWRVILDPMLLGTNNIPREKWEDAALINQLVVSYTSDMIANRMLMITAAAVILTILYFRFSSAERSGKPTPFSLLDLSTATERIQLDPETFEATRVNSLAGSHARDKIMTQSVSLAKVTRANAGLRANLRKLLAATRLELHLLRSEKSLVVLTPLAVLLAFLVLPFSAGASEVSHSAGFASSTANGLLVFLLGVIVFYAGESMHRDRELRIEPILWGAPVPNNVFLISKFLATLLLALFLLLLIGLTAMLTQILRGQTPIEVSTYLITYAVISVPSLAFMGAACLAVNVLLREKYLGYAVIIAVSSGLFYLYSQGYNHWSYNPVLYGLWTESDLSRTPSRLLILRAYCFALAVICLLIAHVGFERRTTSRKL